MRDSIQVLKWYLLSCYKSYFLNKKAKLEKWQRRKANSIVNFAVKNSKFYREFYSGHSLTDLENLPIIDKKYLMDNFSNLNTVGIDVNSAHNIAIDAENSRDFTSKIGDITVGLSSGTSGNRGLFLVSKKERLAWAGAVLAKMLPSHLLTKQRIAFFLRANSNIYTTLKSHLIKFEFYDLLNDLDEHIKNLNQFQPTLLVAPPSMLRMLADEKAKANLLINPIKIISVAEVLEPFDRKYIEFIFKQTVHQIYQATEGFLATTCSYGVLHLNEDIVLIQKEYIDETKKKFIPIITDLYRKTQPIIRYRLNDILTERQEACPCGSAFTALLQIDGRCDDLLYAESLNDGKLKPIFPDFIRRAITTHSPEIQAYQVIQLSPKNLQINLRCNSSLLYDIQKNLKHQLEKLFERTHTICPTINFGEYSDPEKSVKLRRIIRNYPIPKNSAPLIKT